MTKRFALVVLIVAVVLGAAGIYVVSRKTPASETPAVQKFTHIDITLKDGEVPEGASTYLVKPDTGLEFSVTSDKLGKIEVATEQPQTITFTKSPVVFRFTVGKSGSFPLNFLADGSETAMKIGTITVQQSTK